MQDIPIRHIRFTILIMPLWGYLLICAFGNAIGGIVDPANVIMPCLRDAVVMHSRKIVPRAKKKRCSGDGCRSIELVQEVAMAKELPHRHENVYPRPPAGLTAGLTLSSRPGNFLLSFSLTIIFSTISLPSLT